MIVPSWTQCSTSVSFLYWEACLACSTCPPGCHPRQVCPVWLQGCFGRLSEALFHLHSSISTVMSVYVSQPSQKANRLGRHDMSVVNPCCLLAFLSFIWLDEASCSVCFVIFPETGVSLNALEFPEYPFFPVLKVCLRVTKNNPCPTRCSALVLKDQVLKTFILT